MIDRMIVLYQYTIHTTIDDYQYDIDERVKILHCGASNLEKRKENGRQ